MEEGICTVLGVGKRGGEHRAAATLDTFLASSARPLLASCTRPQSADVFVCVGLSRAKENLI